jgi:hypothetical protein
MGKMKEITSDDSSLTCAPMGFDSIHAKGNTEPGFCLVVSLFLDLSPLVSVLLSLCFLISLLFLLFFSSVPASMIGCMCV